MLLWICEPTSQTIQAPDTAAAAPTARALVTMRTSEITKTANAIVSWVVSLRLRSHALRLTRASNHGVAAPAVPGHGLACLWEASDSICEERLSPAATAAGPVDLKIVPGNAIIKHQRVS